ncbi:hypothetical protein NE237_012794 [Protea cynaroides]|uniref:Uncharacterized protein n=1 Tax=Protea cynaroides TaxID=273540 RepID=A0A9Q0JXY8_9MAGN|nr:hypothetical protein NE237_012794 [Protea cynaroides]
MLKIRLVAEVCLGIEDNHPSNVENAVPVTKKSVLVSVLLVTTPSGNRGERNNAQNTNINFISQTGMGSASSSRRLLWLNIANKEDEQNDVSFDVDESDHSHHEEDQNNGDVDSNEVSTINGLGHGQVTSTDLGTVVVSYNEVEKVNNVLESR